MEKLCLEYIWIDSNYNLRSKTKIMKNEYKHLKICDIPMWNFDGSLQVRLLVKILKLF